MAIDPKDREILVQGLSALDDDQLAEVKGKLTKLRDSLDDLNSAFPETKRFLEARGLTKVSQLDEAGRQALTEHLQAVLAKISS